MKKLFQVSAACLPVGPRPAQSWVTRSFQITAVSLSEAELIGLRLLASDTSLQNLEDYAIYARLSDHETQTERTFS